MIALLFKEFGQAHCMTEGASYCILRSRLMWATVREQRIPCWQWVAPIISCESLTSRQNRRTSFVSVNTWSKVLRKWRTSASLFMHCSMYVCLMVRISNSNSPTLRLLHPREGFVRLSENAWNGRYLVNQGSVLSSFRKTAQWGSAFCSPTCSASCPQACTARRKTACLGDFFMDWGCHIACSHSSRLRK